MVPMPHAPLAPFNPDLGNDSDDSGDYDDVADHNDDVLDEGFEDPEADLIENELEGGIEVNFGDEAEGRQNVAPWDRWACGGDISKYEDYFDNPNWEYFVKFEHERFDNTPLLMAEEHVVALRQEYNELKRNTSKDEERRRLLNEAKDRLRNFVDEVAPAIERVCTTAADLMDQLTPLVSQTIDIFPCMRGFFDAMHFSSLFRTFTQAPNPKTIRTYLKALALPVNMAEYLTPTESAPKPKTSVDPTTIEVELSHDKFSGFPVLLKVSPIGNANRATLKTQLKELLGVDWVEADDDARPAYDTKHEPLGWAAVLIRDDARRDAALARLNSAVLGDSAVLLECTRLSDPNNFEERDPFMKHKTKPKVVATTQPTLPSASSDTSSNSTPAPPPAPVKNDVDKLVELLERFGDAGSEDIPCTVDGSNAEDCLPPPPNLDKIMFCFIDFEAALSLKGGTTIPTEVGAVLATLRDGECGRFHRFIDPGSF